MQRLVVCWAALAASAFLMPRAESAPSQPAGDGISLAVTVGADASEGACGTDATLQATAGDQVNFCYLVTNHSTTTLEWHSLVDDLNGPIFIAAPATLAPGETYQYNRVETATSS